MDAEIHCKGIKAQTFIGVHSHEQAKRQLLVIDLVMTFDSGRASETDTLIDVPDYEEAVNWVAAFALRSRFHLLERFAEELARLMLKRYKLKQIDLRITKPNALLQAEVSLAISRAAD